MFPLVDTFCTESQCIPIYSGFLIFIVRFKFGVNFTLLTSIGSLHQQNHPPPHSPLAAPPHMILRPWQPPADSLSLPSLFSHSTFLPLTNMLGFFRENSQKNGHQFGSFFRCGYFGGVFFRCGFFSASFFYVPVFLFLLNSVWCIPSSAELKCNQNAITQSKKLGFQFMHDKFCMDNMCQIAQPSPLLQIRLRLKRRGLKSLESFIGLWLFPPQIFSYLNNADRSPRKRGWALDVLKVM